MLDEVIPNVYRLEAGGVNLYLCVEETGLTLIDSGLPKKEKLVLAAIAEIGRQPTDLKHILITHADMDHVGSLAAIQAGSGAKVHASRETAAYLQRGRSPQHMPWPVQLMIDLFIRYKPVPAGVIENIQAGDILPIMDGLHVLATPGHTREHHSFYIPAKGILFAGDALNTRDGRLQPTPDRITADKEAARQSAIRLLELAPAIFACGHGDPSHTHGSDDIMVLFNQLRNR